MKKTNKKVVIAGIVLVVLVVALLVIYKVAKPATTQGAKTVTIEVVNKDKASTTYTVNTDAEYLKQAMDEASAKGLTYSGTESAYGIMVDTVNGELADYNVDGSYWAFYVNNEYCNYGISEQPVNDKDVFKIEYTVFQ